MTVKQIGGDHYQSSYQHWDWAIDIHLGYLESAATKYISRWRTKGGVEDLKKALSYIEKLRHAYALGKRNQSLLVSKDINTSNLAVSVTSRFLENNKIIGLEYTLCFEISSWISDAQIMIIIDKIKLLITTATEVSKGSQSSSGSSPTQKQSASVPGQAEVAGDGPTIDDARRTPVHQQGTEHPAPFGFDYSADDGD